ncbi:MAG: hypothetical protein NC350_04300 [Corallococcus sp.]|nr:hypothetical protein [Corallococcus sp.]
MNGQMGVFCCFVATGFCASLGLQLVCGIKMCKGKFVKTVCVIAESVYACAAFAVVWAVNLKINYGIFRPYVPIAFGLGCLAYYATLYTALDKAMCSLYNFFTAKVGKDNEKDISE